MADIDGFVLAVPSAKREAFRKVAEAALAVFRKHGAARVVECWGEHVPEGTLTSLPMAVKRPDDEAVGFSWIAWPLRAARDAGTKAATADPRLKPDAETMPFDGKRMIYGGFEVILDA